jgi:hypothetical protein
VTGNGFVCRSRQTMELRWMQSVIYITASHHFGQAETEIKKRGARMQGGYPPLRARVCVVHAAARAAVRTRPRLALHAPAPDGQALQRIEHEMLDQQADGDDDGEPRKHLVRVQLVARLENIPAQAALAGGGAEHQLSGDQGAPGE